jgi:ABC-2 type transport system permease protein
MIYLRLINKFWQASLQEEAAYRANFFFSLLYSFLNLFTGAAGVWILFSQVDTIRGWDFAGTLALLGVYLTASALRRLFIGPSLESLAGMDGEVWSGSFDFTLLRPINTQFLASFRKWRPLALFEVLLGVGVLAAAVQQFGTGFSAERLLAFILALLAAVAVLYALLLGFTAFVFWSPGVLFTWIFDAVFQMARYPLGYYPGWIRLVLTWVIPVGVITTLPAEALTGLLDWQGLAVFALLAAGLVAVASLLFRTGLTRYKSASS